MRNNIVIIGGGITALMAAALIRREDSRRTITIVEQNEEFGGLLRSFDCGKFGRFDIGMHFMIDSGIADLDEFQRSLLPEDQWHVLDGLRHDGSGAFFNGRLQQHTQYPDLRTLDPGLYAKCMTDFFLNLRPPSTVELHDALEYARGRFGKSIAETVFAPIVEKLHQRPVQTLDPSVTKHPPLDRVVLFDEEPFRDLMASELLRARIAYPEQRRLPVKYSSGRASFYPKVYGIYQVIEALLRRLQDERTRLLNGTRVIGLTVSGSRVQTVRLKRGEENLEITDIDGVYWAANLMQLAKHFRLFRDPLDLDPFLKTVIVNFLFDRPAEIGDLYHFWCFDAPFRTFRVTNYCNYCPGAARAEGYPLCVELLVDPSSPTDASLYQSMALDELKAFGVLPHGIRTIFADVRVLPTGFPFPKTLKNRDALDRVRGSIRAMGLTNLTTMGILSEPDLFLQHEVLSDMYRKVVQGL